MCLLKRKKRGGIEKKGYLSFLSVSCLPELIGEYREVTRAERAWHASLVAIASSVDLQLVLLERQPDLLSCQHRLRPEGLSTS